MKVVICGGGIIGVTTAYFLALRGVDSVIIEESGIACAASGNAGGFLARSWCDHNEMGALARFSFDVHMKLAEQFLNCDYRVLHTLEINVARGGTRQSHESLPDWVDGHISKTSVMGTPSETAQVHPRKLCEALLAAAQAAANVTVRIARVTGFTKSDARTVSAVQTRGAANELQEEPADAVVIAMGPWSGTALRWLGKAPVVNGRRAHGLVLKPKAGSEEAVSPHALFVEVKGRGPTLGAEVYPRPDGTIFLCGMSDAETLPASVRDVKVDDDIVAKMKSTGDQVSSVIAESTVERKQSCYMPMSMDHFPLIGKVEDFTNVTIGAGHSCWGILNGPGTGMILAELVATDECHLLDIKPFAPVRLLGN